ncbi:MAG: molybdopterin-converting factor chain 2 [Gemmatimonas sp.]|nr:molybdopterin-converting factor chain 2 [Gemmatimonas sp.]
MRIALVDHPLDPTALLAEVADVGSGASTLFVGTVRRTNQGRAVTGIDYSAYAPMAEAEMQRIAEEAAAKFGCTHLVIEHRLGTLLLGEASIAIAVSHERRGAAMDAQRYVIEEFKARVPIWKREHYVDGDRAWVDNAGGAVPAEPDASVGDSTGR